MSKYSQHLLLLVSVVFLSAGISTSFGEHPKAREIENILATLAQQRANNNIIYVKGNYRSLRESDASAEDGSSTDQADFELWMDINNPSRFRIDYQPRISRWRNASSDRFGEIISISSNGQVQVELKHEHGPAGKLMPVKTATLAKPSIEEVHNALLYTGLGATLQLVQIHGSPQPLLFEDILRRVDWQIEGPEDEDSSMVKITVGNPDVLLSETFGINLGSKNLSSKETRIFAPSGDLIARHLYEASNLVKIDNGMYIPKLVTYELRVHDSVRRWLRIEIEEAKLLSQDEKYFEIEIPSGYYVTDDRYGVSFTVGDSPEDIIKNIERKIDGIKDGGK